MCAVTMSFPSTTHARTEVGSASASFVRMVTVSPSLVILAREGVYVRIGALSFQGRGEGGNQRVPVPTFDVSSGVIVAGVIGPSGTALSAPTSCLRLSRIRE